MVYRSHGSVTWERSAVGQVFEAKAVQCRKVPHLDDFPEIVERVRHHLQDVPSVKGALVCGSVIRGDHNLRSDIDCFVLYDESDEREAQAHMKLLTLLAKKRHVPLNFVPCDTLLAYIHMHHLGPSFVEHMRRSAETGGLLKGDPLSKLTSDLSPKEELVSYMRTKMYNLQEAWTGSSAFSDERVTAFSRKLLEAPLHVARKVLGYRQQLAEDSKAYIQARYLEDMPEGLAMQLKGLLSRDAWYTEQLRQHLETFNGREYGDVLKEIVDSAGDVLSFIRANLVHFAEAARS